MQLLPLIGALLLSAAPVQASKTPQELMKPCEVSEEAYIACQSIGTFIATRVAFLMLCGLKEDGISPAESWDTLSSTPTAFKEDYQKVMWNEAINSVLQEYPNCPIKPIR